MQICVTHPPCVKKVFLTHKHITAFVQYFRVLYREATWPQVSMIYQPEQRAWKRKQRLSTRKVITYMYALTETHMNMEHSNSGVIHRYLLLQHSCLTEYWIKDKCYISQNNHNSWGNLFIHNFWFQWKKKSGPAICNHCVSKLSSCQATSRICALLGIYTKHRFHVLSTVHPCIILQLSPTRCTIQNCAPGWTYLQDYTGMHSQQNIKFSNAKQAKSKHQYKKLKTKLYETNAAIWYNTMCGLK